MVDTSAKHQKASLIRRTALTGLVVNASLTLLKGYAGIAAGSRAMLADAVHSLSDLTTDVAVLIGARYWCKPPDASHPVGHSGIETAVSMFIGLVLIAAGLGLGVDSIKTLDDPGSLQPPGALAAAAALVSLVVKELLCRWILVRSRKTGSVALAANAMHSRSDALSSIPVLVAVSLSAVAPDLALLDSITGVVVSVFVILSGWKILKPGLIQMTAKAPPEEVVERIRNTALSVKGVMGIHDLRARYQPGGIFVDLHIQLPGDMSVHKGFLIGKKVEQAILREEPAIRDVVARFEPWAPCGDADKCPGNI